MIGRYFPEYEADDHPPAIARRRGAERLEAALDHLVAGGERDPEPAGLLDDRARAARARRARPAGREREVVRVGRRGPSGRTCPRAGSPRSPSRAGPAPSGRGAPGGRGCRSTASRGRGSRAGAARWGSPSPRRAGGRRSGSRRASLVRERRVQRHEPDPLAGRQRRLAVGVDGRRRVVVERRGSGSRCRRRRCGCTTRRRSGRSGGHDARTPARRTSPSACSSGSR